MSDNLWKEVSLGEICQFKYGKSLPGASRDPGPVVVYGSNGPVGKHSTPLTNGPTIVIGRKGSLGEVTYADSSCWPIDTTYYIDSSATNADLRWLYYRLTAIGLKDLNRAAAVPGLNREDAYRKRLLLPSSENQRRIAEVLDQANKLRAKRRQAIAMFDELTESIFVDMFGRLDEHNGWPIKDVDEICDLVIDCINKTAPTVDRETPFKMIRTTNVKNGRVDLAEIRYVDKNIFQRWNRRATPRYGDVILTREAPVGEAGILASHDQVFLGQRLMLYRTNREHIVPRYLLAVFRSDFLRHQFDKHGSGSTVKHLPLPACRSFRIPVPPLELQHEFSRRIAAVESIKNQHNSQLEELDDLFDSLQHRAFHVEL